jgi:superfamily II DNA or RNA helicase
MNKNHMFKVKEAKYSLYPHQQKAINELKKSILKGNKKIALCLATNAGKSIISYDIAYNAMKKGKNVLYSVHRTVLTDQMNNKFFGLDNVIVETWQTSINREHDKVDIIIADECHYASGSKLQEEVYKKYPNAFIIGLSATPIESNGSRLKGWDEILDIIQLKELIEINKASPFKILAPKSNIKFDELKKTSSDGDFNKKEVEKQVTKSSLIGDVMGAFKQYGYKDGKPLKTIFYAITQKHCEELEKELKKDGIKCESYHSGIQKHKRKQIIEHFKDNKIKVLVSVDALTTGLDIPDIYCIVLATPTKSWVKTLQIVGRIVRLNDEDPNKEGIIIDCCDVIKNTIHPLDDLDLNMVIEKKEKNKCSKCMGKVIIIKKEIFEEKKLLKEGVMKIKITYRCIDCNYTYSKIETFQENVSICENEECKKEIPKDLREAGFNKIEKEEGKFMEFYTKCPFCNYEKVYREVELIDTLELEEIKLTTDDIKKVSTWEELRKVLKKAKKQNGEFYHHYWRVKTIESLQKGGVSLGFAKQEIEAYLSKEWVLGNIANKILEKYSTFNNI